MSDRHNLDEFLRQQLSASGPLPESLVAAARHKVVQRKKTSTLTPDIFSAIAAFLNFKVKLYHAIITVVIVGFAILYFTRKSETPPSQAGSEQYTSNIAAVRNSTVLSSINTFVTYK